MEGMSGCSFGVKWDIMFGKWMSNPVAMGNPESG